MKLCDLLACICRMHKYLTYSYGNGVQGSLFSNYEIIDRMKAV